MKIVKTILFALFGIAFIIFGANKFFHFMPEPVLTAEQKLNFEAFMRLKWLMPLVGSMEMLGGLLAIFPKTRALGAIIIFPIMVGIVLYNFTMDASGIPIASVFAILNLWLLFDNREKYKKLLS